MSNIFRGLCAALSTFALFIHSSFADSTTDIVITADRRATPIEEVGSSITVLNGETLEESSESSVLEVLRRVPGLVITQAGGPGRQASIILRGADSDQTLVLLDGVRVNDSNVGGFDLSDLKLENIERIEIIRGPQSVLYGSQAIGGVINIISKEANDGFSARAQVRGGSYGTQDYLFSSSYGEEAIRSSTSISVLKSDGYSAANRSRGNPEADSYENVSVSNRTSLKVLGNGEATATVRYQRGETEIDGFDFAVGAVDDLNASQERELITSSFKLRKPINNWLVPSLELGVTDENLEGRDPDTEFNNFNIDSSLYNATIKSELDLFPSHELLVGYTYERQEGENSGNFDESRDINSVFFQDRYSWRNLLYLGGGARLESDSEFGEEITFRATAAFLLSQVGARLHSSVGTGFKAPSFNELYFPGFGNPDLNPETSIGFDIGLEKEFSTLNSTLDVTFYYNDFEDLIGFDSTTFTAVNVAKAKAYGLETSFEAIISEALKFAFQHTYTKSEDKNTGKLLPRRPRHRANFNIFYQIIEGWDVAVDFLVVHSRIESDGQDMDDYERLDLSSRYKLNKHFRLFVSLDNVFDVDYEEVVGFGSTRFAAYAGVEASL
jgi:vitamin B12 transporter